MVIFQLGSYTTEASGPDPCELKADVQTALFFCHFLVSMLRMKGICRVVFSGCGSGEMLYDLY